MKASVLFTLAVAVVPAFAIGAAHAQTAPRCSCEHYGNPYDGYCEAWPQSGTETYGWQTTGNAYFPFQPSPTQPAMVYGCPLNHPDGCGLKVTISRPGYSPVTKNCLNGTPPN